MCLNWDFVFAQSKQGAFERRCACHEQHKAAIGWLATFKLMLERRAGH